MGLRLRSIRQRIFLLTLVPVLSLIALYVFATFLTARGALTLSEATTIKNVTGVPTGAFLSQIDAERPLAIVYLSSPTGANLASLQVQQSKTDAVAHMLQTDLNSPGTMNNATAPEKQAIATLLTDVKTLPGLRAQVHSQIISKSRALNEYNAMVADSYSVIDQAILEQTNATLVTQAQAFIRMGRAEDLMLQESSVISGDLAARSFPAADRQLFTQLVGARRTLFAQTLPDLQPQYRIYYTRDISPQASTALTGLEDHLMSDTRTAAPPPVQPLQWEAAVGGVAAGLSKAATQASDVITAKATANSDHTYLELFLAGGLGLLAVVLSILVSLVVGRGIVRELAALRDAALELAHKRLPDVVRRLAAGQDVDVTAEAPELPASSDEIGQVQQAFVAVQQTAVEAAVGQARLRQGISDIFRNLARRSQSLLHRQLALLDAMERRAREPEELEDLFRIDHLTTRMRRHAESLIILSGDAPARAWRRPVPFVDVLRAAVAEVEDYTRIKVTASTRAAIAGPVVADVIHMIAELAENAVVFSPPNTPVLISGDVVGRGFAVEIEDRGLGLSEERRAELNDLLENPPPFDLSGSDQLGLFVASQLAKKHNIRISLRGSPYGGTTAIVLIPITLVITEESYQQDGTDQGTGVQLSGRHAARDDTSSFTTVPATRAGPPGRPRGPAGSPWPCRTTRPSGGQTSGGRPTAEPIRGRPTSRRRPGPPRTTRADGPARERATPRRPATGGTGSMGSRIPATRQPGRRLSTPGPRSLPGTASWTMVTRTLPTRTRCRAGCARPAWPRNCGRTRWTGTRPRTGIPWRARRPRKNARPKRREARSPPSSRAGSGAARCSTRRRRPPRRRPALRHSPVPGRPVPPSPAPRSPAPRRPAIRTMSDGRGSR